MIEALYLALLLIKKFEGCRLKAYQDIVGIWTIGYGETLGVVEGMVWTQEQAESVLKQRVGYFLLTVIKNCPQLHLEPPSRIAACTSLAYNIGIGAFRASSVCRYTKLQEFDKAGVSILLWDKAGGRRRKGLTIRRKLEKVQYDY
jgi:lysozyme